MSSTAIILIVTFLMCVMFLIGKYPYGIIAMSACTLLCITGVLDIGSAFAGLCNKTVIMIASMYALSCALGKTSLIRKIKGSVALLNGKKDMLLVLSLYLVVTLFQQFLPAAATLSIMLVVMSALTSSGKVTTSKILLPMLCVTSVTECLFPVGMGATLFMSDNALIEGIVQNSAYSYHITDWCKVAILPAILVFIYASFIWKRIPNSKINEESIEITEEEKEEKLPAWQEYLIYALFVITVGCLIMSNVIGNNVYIVPVTGLLILAFTKVLSKKEIIANVASDSVWMIAGVMTISTALGNSDAGELIGNFVLKLLGNTDSGLLIMFVITLVTTIMTTMLSNMGTYLILMPIAASVAMVAGMDPRGICLCVSIGCQYAWCFPTGSPGCAVAFGAGGFNPFKMLKYTLPALLIAIVGLVFSAYLWFPPVPIA